MKLTDLIREPVVRQRIKPLRPMFPRKMMAPLLVAPRTRSDLVGSAFDYLLRFEIHRRSEKASGVRWVADHAPDVLRAAHRGEYQLRVRTPDGGPPSPAPPPGGFLRAAKRADRVLANARNAFENYIIHDPVPDARPQLAAHAIRLARLDLIYRAHFVETEFDRADPGDVEDLLAMLDVVPFTEFQLNRRVLLNPTFGTASLEIGGADADLITGDLLIDLKTTKQDTIEASYLDQLLGYYFLARRARLADKRFPLVRQVGLYFARRGFMWTMNTAEWTSNPIFRSTETWFFEYASQLRQTEKKKVSAMPSGGMGNMY